MTKEGSNHPHADLAWLSCIALGLILFLHVLIPKIFGNAKPYEIDIAVDYVATQIAQETATPMPSEEGLRE